MHLMFVIIFLRNLNPQILKVFEMIFDVAWATIIYSIFSYFKERYEKYLKHR